MPVQDFLSQRAVNVVVGGSYTLPNWYDPQGKLRTFACRTTRVSPFRMVVEVPVVGKVGDRLTSYFRDFGKFEGSISDTMDRSFMLELEMTRERRERLSDMLTWLEKKQKNPA
ncbi:MAG: PilZ domain-containing protein, partial [Bradyrhizobium sp.]|nr:PilZ domain-containing protein [Bradyrhizobium sp.]